MENNYREKITVFLNSLGIKPKDISLYEIAFTHSSYNGEANTKHHDYQRLEFIGDSVINFTVADLIYKNYKDTQEGLMTKMRADLVQTKSLSKYAKNLGLENYILIGYGLKVAGGISKKILEDVFEALTGAIYEDQGIDIAYNYLTKIFLDDIINFDESSLTDYKTRLQEEIQSDNRGNVVYKVIEKTGPAHNPMFVVEVQFNEVKLGHGRASSKKAAEQLAAKDALNKKAV